jgi:hypothetical protein
MYTHVATGNGVPSIGSSIFVRMYIHEVDPIPYEARPRVRPRGRLQGCQRRCDHAVPFLRPQRPR